MESLTTALNQARKSDKPLLAFFVGDGDWCKWCNVLKAAHTKNPEILEKAKAEQGIGIAWIPLQRKDSDTSGIREELDIRSIPTAILFEANGKILAKTEYLEKLDTVGIQAYVDWANEALKRKADAFWE